jgi:ribosome biogenesis SPOUT family RNA methylase Rps3
MISNNSAGRRYVVEHLEDEVYDWCLLEYKHMQKYLNSQLIITNVPTKFHHKFPSNMTVHSESYADLFLNKNLRIGLLDQCGSHELQPTDDFDVIVCGGILGCDEFEGPLVDRTSQLRREGVECVHLGPVQMTADTAMIVSHLILDQKKKMSDFQFSDRPSLKIGKKQFVDMPFRYLVGDDGVLLPDGMLDLLKQDFCLSAGDANEDLQVDS